MRWFAHSSLAALVAASTACSGTVDPGGSADGGEAGGGSADAAPEVDFASLPWADIGNGVAYKDSGNPRGNSIFIGYAGYAVDDSSARSWVSALYPAALRASGVRHVFAVRGPATVEYEDKEIQNSLLIERMLPLVGPDTVIAVAAHSSGAWVACELLQQLYDQGFDPAGVSSGRIVYYDLDGLYGCLDETIAGNLRGLHFVYASTAVDGGGASLNAESMIAGADLYGALPLAYDASASGCQPGAAFCLHVSLINTVPHDPSNGTPLDYADFAGRPVNTWYIEQTAADLAP